MRKLTYGMNPSLDGYIAATADQQPGASAAEISWLPPNGPAASKIVVSSIGWTIVHSLMAARAAIIKLRA